MEAIKANLLNHQIGSFSPRSRYWSRFVTPAGGDDDGDDADPDDDRDVHDCPDCGPDCEYNDPYYQDD